jgi:eukaryotic-like serine/threonine-protein kinase
MSDSRYSPESDALFGAIFELRPEARAKALDTACPDLRREVESLLAAHDASGSFMRQPIAPPRSVASAAPGVDSSADARLPGIVGSRIGAFTVVDQIGRGGMSEVYRAGRSDGTFDQLVAIKIAHVPLADPEAMRRFKVERQILAVLQHPHIVTLIDGGALPDGRLYLVTELVSGAPITTHCRDARRSLEARLRLVRMVCQAVHYAHEHGVVHRDLKPANLFVTPEGVPKILDFGVAKLLSPWPGLDAGAAQTGHAAGPLTLNYASPEQLRGLPVTPASDVYSLGILLYEIIAGARPYETTGQPLDHVLALVVDALPTRPSAADVPAIALPYDRQRLRGDLDAIVLKAIAKEPERRYASAEALADDIARFLGGKPVLARKPSLSYRLRKLANRHKTIVVTVLAAAIGVLAALGIALAQRAQADVERAKADHQQLELSRAYRQIGQVLSEPGTPNLGLRTQAVQRLRQSRELARALAARPDADAASLEELMEANRALAAILTLQGETAEARTLARETAALADALAKPGAFHARRRYSCGR